MRKKSNRAGFTLVELLIVIVIIGILLALIVPAVNQARRRANIAKARSEIAQLASAIGAFKVRYGVDPPSRFQIFEDPANWNLPANAAIKGTIRRMWPQFDFTLAHDFNSDGDTTDMFTLDGAECLVFFLGGMQDAGGKPAGFSPNPANPFVPPPLPPAVPGTRVGPFFEFDVGRLIDTDLDGVREYRDSMSPTQPIVYYSSYEGKGYPPADLCFGMTDFYRPSANSSPYQAQSFQLIGAGLDGLLGNGGVYDPQNAGLSLATGRPSVVGDPNQGGIAEYDNITNFGSGVLNP